jgi:hypothetical protein
MTEEDARERFGDDAKKVEGSLGADAKPWDELPRPAGKVVAQVRSSHRDPKMSPISSTTSSPNSR